MTELIIRLFIAIVLGLGSLCLIISSFIFYIQFYRGHNPVSQKRVYYNFFKLLSGIIINIGNTSINIHKVVELYMNLKG